jgi:hypothetical protein
MTNQTLSDIPSFVAAVSTDVQPSDKSISVLFVSPPVVLHLAALHLALWCYSCLNVE